jgi:hypothetical protein
MESSTPPRDTAWAMSQENVEVIRQAVEAFDRRDRVAWLAFRNGKVVRWVLYPTHTEALEAAGLEK